MKALLPLVAAALLLGAAACGDDDAKARLSGDATATAQRDASPQAGSRPSGSPSPTAAADEPLDATEVIRSVRESVVRIRAGGEQPAMPFGAVVPAEGTGTGFIVDERGYIVTNNHVVTLGTDQPTSRFEVDLWNGETHEATLVGRDPRTDLAVLKIDAKNLKPLRFADPDSVAVGQGVVAIGFALDLGSSPTVTTGVVSAKDRVINETLIANGRPMPIEISGAVQTDAAINPGNSGGPLVNLRGEVVGVNTAGLVGVVGRPVQGIFFAVSSRVAEPIVKALIEEGGVERGYIGVRATTITREIAQANRLDVEAGAGVVAVESGSPAERAGLQAGDVITRIGDRAINNVGDVSAALFEHGPGTSVTIEFVRGKERKTAQITPAPPPASGA